MIGCLAANPIPSLYPVKKASAFTEPKRELKAMLVIELLNSEKKKKCISLMNLTLSHQDFHRSVTSTFLLF